MLALWPIHGESMSQNGTSPPDQGPPTITSDRWKELMDQAEKPEPRQCDCCDKPATLVLAFPAEPVPPGTVAQHSRALCMQEHGRYCAACCFIHLQMGIAMRLVWG